MMHQHTNHLLQRISQTAKKVRQANESVLNGSIDRIRMALTQICIQAFIQITWARLCALAVVSSMGWSGMAAADIAKPKIGGAELSGEDPIADISTVIGGAGSLGTVVLQIVMYLVAAYLVITGLITGWKKGEWGMFIIGLVVALIMVISTTYFLSQGETAMEGLKS